MSKKDPQASLHLNSNQQTWVAAMCTAKGESFEIPPLPLESRKEIAYRQDRERRAVEGDICALADLIRVDPYYLKTTRFVETIRVLRSERRFAPISGMLTHATRGLTLLADALRGITPEHDNRGKRAIPAAKDVSKLYGLLLPVYQSAKRGEVTSPVAEIPYVLWRYFDARNFDEYYEMPNGITPFVEGGTTSGKVCLSTSPFFTIPAMDLERLKSERPSEVAMERVKRLFNIGRMTHSGETRDLTWVQKRVAAGRKRGA